jgi:glycerol uptake facilitator-like aquaporin
VKMPMRLMMTWSNVNVAIGIPVIMGVLCAAGVFQGHLTAR